MGGEILMTILASVILAAGGGAGVTSIQAGSIAVTGTSATDTITSVDLSNSIVLFNGQWTGFVVTEDSLNTRVSLTNSTTVTANRNSSSGTINVNYTVIEFSGGINFIEQNTGVNISDGNDYVDVALSQSVDLAKTAIFYGGYETTRTSSEGTSSVSLLNTNTVRVHAQNGAGSVTTSFTVLEFS